MNEDLLQFHAAELMDSHASLDSIGVPRRCSEGELLSISQRTAQAVRMYQAVLAAGTVLMRAAGR